MDFLLKAPKSIFTAKTQGLIILSAFLLTSFSSSAKFSVLWWNIGYNEYSLPSKNNSSYSNLEETFMNHNWGQYEIVALGEYIHGTMGEDSLREIKKTFPYQQVIQYNDFYKKSIYLLSKRKLQVKIEELDWVSPYISREKQESYRDKQVDKYGPMGNFKRKYIRVSTNIDKLNYHFVFYHFNNPWVLYLENGNKLKVAYELLFGSRNPLMNQINQFYEKIKNDIGDDYRNQRVVLMGDSNCPEKAKGFTPKCFDLLQSILPLVNSDKTKSTYPAPGSTVWGSGHSVKIDHVQVSPVVKAETRTLEIEGSDHRAVEVLLRE